MARFTQIPADTFEKLQINAGMLLSAFEPTTGEYEATNILGATSGGITFTDAPSYVDFGEDIDNCPKNTKELKRIESREITLAGTYVTMSSNSAKSLINGASIEGNKITPSDALTDADFNDIWLVGDYSDDNSASTGGFIAIHLMNAMSTGGFALQTADKGKGTYAFTYTAHYSIDAQNVVPYEVYIKAGA